MEEKYSDKLHSVMITKGWRQNKVAEELGTSPAHVNRILKGTHQPSKSLAMLINSLVLGQNERSDIHANPTIQEVITLMMSMDKEHQEEVLKSARKELIVYHSGSQKAAQETLRQANADFHNGELPAEEQKGQPVAGKSAPRKERITSLTRKTTR